ncbi:hypothetical protein A2291_00120 [candidate division WOR-1 bacterium RIFOXYB2_FULL_42_35]|uniref:Polymerase beta nucleotidyltransferase domain-containing protein n=1 Tax=candidate division WOR-1 bacterium RIFOXYC2_FULL_41_25 TaxID=1802586 RepID=A0A1F4TM61_UNCSA|nr:MAG: hypothetical protein A2247_05640 [candidate division WOR-1 bacterium RIFOXYA2_FULL_41_14]OGC24125.1 MAG: hypothetical protein A2291_00120 [candidate division WOR-1 bacterium RIFOXYB2_FULL_42_35]OGC33812.1 MAG: hypothetical protein A2462_01795 [candidate division WOR-1 bacterium RIFOXYC2_FULL_41_25]OGC43705.1 MAG: hypothetical protein A2548_05345 [candidate division WOR-1 bacterium RIFOXYD2_FULL_41_8]
MNNEILTNDLKNKIVAVINKRLRLPHYKLFIFGSHVDGTATERSDIDVGVEAPEKIPVAEKLEIEDELSDLPILQKIDFVDFNDIGDGFRRVALKKIEVIYER